MKYLGRLIILICLHFVLDLSIYFPTCLFVSGNDNEVYIDDDLYTPTEVIYDSDGLPEITLLNPLQDAKSKCCTHVDIGERGKNRLQSEA